MLFWRQAITEASADVVTWEDKKKVETPTPILTESLPPLEPLEKALLPESERQPHSPMDVKILSADDLYTMKILYLGNIVVRKTSEGGFLATEDAIKALKFEAVKKYANQALGISNIEFQTGMTVHGRRIQEAYADVVFWEPGEEVAGEARRESIPHTYEGIEESRAYSNIGDRIFAPHQVKMLGKAESPTKYEALGKVAVKVPTRNGLTKSEIDRALREKAVETFGEKAWGIRNITYENANCLRCQGQFKSASGEVVKRK